MDIEIENSHPTLLPYLQPDTPLRLDLLPSHVTPDDASDGFPFETLDRQDPFARFIKARFVTDADSHVADLILWMQRDFILSEKTDHALTTNPAVDHLWQQASARLSKTKTMETGFIRLKGQLNPDGTIAPFSPLFYCQFKKRFFPPPCPLCGGLLDLCRDTEMLLSANLDSYSDSFTRYLYCATCFQLAGETDFYVCRRSNRNESNVKSAADLIAAYKHLTGSTSPVAHFPCRECTEAPLCHTSDGPSAHRIVPVAFYPFYMFVFDAAVKSTNNLSLTFAANNDLDPISKPEQILPSMPSEEPPLEIDTNRAIRTILSRLIAKWQQEDDQKKANVSTLQPSFSTPSSSAMPPITKSLTGKEGSPDFKETIIVPSGSDPSSAPPNSNIPSNPNPPPNQDLPETIMVKAVSTEAKQSIWPQTETPDALPESPSRDRLKSQQPSRQDTPPLPETIIVRPSKSNEQHPHKGPAPTHESTDPLGKSFTFNGGKRAQNHKAAKDPQAQFLKTFRLGQGLHSKNPLKESPQPPPKANKKHTPETSKDPLAETIIVKPQSPKKKDD